jgi:MFS family permease
MSQQRREDGHQQSNATIALRLDAVPANDVHAASSRRGPLGLPFAYWVLWSGVLVNRLGGTVFVFLGVYLTHQRGLRPELAGLIISLNFAGGLFAGPVGGLLADRVGRRATLLAGTLGAGVLMLALGLTRSTVALMIVAACLGFFTDLCRPAQQAAVADLVAPADRPRAYGLLYWAFNLGFAAAAPLGGALAEHHFTLLFVLDATSTLAFGGVVLLGLPETRPAPSAVAGRAPLGASFAAPFRDRGFVVFAAIQVLLMLAFVQVVVALPLDLRAHGLSTAVIGWLFSFNGLLIVFVQPLALKAIRNFGGVGWLAAGSAFAGVGLGATALASGPLGFAAATAIWTVGEICFSVAVPTVLAGLAPVHQRGIYQGTYQLAWGTASTVAPVLGSAVLAHWGGRALWLGCLAAGVLAAALHLRFTLRLTRSRQGVPS